jgi:hypothetical protein
VTEEARERWQAEHRRQRVRERTWGPRRRAAAAVLFWLFLALALAFAALGLFVAWGWGLGAFVAFYLALRMKGIRPFQGGPTEGFDAYTD